MKFKLTVPLFILGLASSTALAATSAASNESNNTGFLNQQFQNMNNSPNVDTSATWFNRIGISGLLNVDAWAQSNAAYLTQNRITAEADYYTTNISASAVSIEAAVLNLQAQVNSWIRADINLFYADGAINDGNYAQLDPSDSLKQPIGIWGAQPTRYLNWDESGLIADEAYIDVGNFQQAPIMLRAGRQYLPFGHYDRYAISPTLTQQLSELRETALQLAFANPAGFHGAVYGFKGLQQFNVDSGGAALQSASNRNDNLNNGGANLGYTNFQNPIGIDLGVGYLYNLADAGIFSNDMRVYNEQGEEAQSYYKGYIHRVGAWAANAEIMPGPFALGLNYVTAIGAFNHYNFANLITRQALSPSAGDVYGSYQFSTYGYASKLSASYQWSEQAYYVYSVGADLMDGLSKQRQSLEYDVNVLRDTVLSFEYRHDLSYGTNYNGRDLGNNTETMQISVLL